MVFQSIHIVTQCMLFGNFGFRKSRKGPVIEKKKKRRWNSSICVVMSIFMIELMLFENCIEFEYLMGFDGRYNIICNYLRLKKITEWKSYWNFQSTETILSIYFRITITIVHDEISFTHKKIMFCPCAVCCVLFDFSAWATDYYRAS